MALDQCADDPRPYIEAAAPAHPSLIDTEHRVADLYGVINVPTAVWIDERGTIVRPNDVAFGSEMFKDLTGFDSAAYLDAVRAWVNTGQHALSDDQARAGLPKVTEKIAEAHARFRLGVWLREHGRTTEGDRQMDIASSLHPESWSMWRQAADLVEVGKASGPEFWKRVQALGDRPYYPPPKL